MCDYIIEGGRPLAGNVAVHGAKNAVLPILAAIALGEGISEIDDCPALSDVVYSEEILECLGCRVKRDGNSVLVDANNIKNCRIPDALMHKMRSSITFLGSVTARCGEAAMSLPGGCELGARPIDLHLKALKKLGVRIEEKGGYIRTRVRDLRGADIHLDFPSVGATENVMLAAVKARGTTIITNAAKEPEIVDLQNFLNKMGASIKGAGTDVIFIEGVKALDGTKHVVMPDRIVASTYLCAAAITGGSVELTNVIPEHVNAITAVLREAGANIITGDNKISIEAPRRLKAVDMVRTQPYPGFPTDAQAIITAALSVAEGTSIVIENIFENRFKHCAELCKMGANIQTKGNVAVIKGVSNLDGAKVSAMELRGGAALVLAGLRANGETIVTDTEHIDRGYDSFAEDLARLGAHIKRGNKDGNEKKEAEPH